MSDLVTQTWAAPRVNACNETVDWQNGAHWQSPFTLRVGTLLCISMVAPASRDLLDRVQPFLLERSAFWTLISRVAVAMAGREGSPGGGSGIHCVTH